VRQLWLAFAVLCFTASTADAQVRGPISPYVFDVRGFSASLGQDPTTASNLRVPAAELPSRGFGGVVGVHVYPLRRERLALGIGGEIIRASGRMDPPSSTGSTPAASATPPIQQRLFGISPALSLNFGHRDGWSYLTAGVGPMSFSTFKGKAAPAEAPPRKNTINMGGGARWFASPRVAFTFDVRFYLTRPEEITGLYPGRARQRLRILSAGISLR
jgi:hypothetical protein